MGLFDGIGKFFGQQPGAIQAGGTMPGVMAGRDVGDLLKPPTQAAPTSFLDRLQTPDARGLTFGDKLFASGAILQGDSGGAASFIQNQRSVADQLAQRERQQGLAQQGTEALQNSLKPDGTLDFRTYLRLAGAAADPGAALKVQEGLSPDYATMSGPRGQLTAVNKRNPRDFFNVRDAGPMPTGMFDENGQLNPLYFQGIEQKAAAERRGKPLAPRVGRAAAVTTGRPPGY